MNKVKKIICNMKIRTKIIVIYISILILSILLSYGVFAIINQRYTEQEVGTVAMQTASALKGNMDFIFENVSQFSDLIYFDKNVQDSLGRVNDRNIDPVIQQTIRKSLVNMLLSGDYMENVFIFDKYYNSYSATKQSPILVDNEKIQTAPWYLEAKEHDGGIVFSHGTDGVLRYPTRKNKNCIILARMISDQNDYSPLATLLISIDESTFLEYFDAVGEEYDSQYCIVDSRNHYIIPPAETNPELDQLLLQNEIAGSGYKTMTYEEEKTIVVKQEMGIQDWSLVGMMPTNSRKVMGNYQKSLIALIILLNILVVFVCSVTLMKLIFKPLSNLQEYMGFAEQEQFREIPITEGNANEINDLKKGFNAMIHAIEQLIEKIKGEEKTIAKNELDLLRAQINPHFLYNTLDAVSALALLGDNDNCFKMTQALGMFYRNSLSSGRELVTVADEMDCIRSYVTILNVRYNDGIHLEVDVEEQIQRQKILKLILQPIVENAVHHGIRNRDGMGTIAIKGYQDEDEMIFIVTDDGVGMTEEQVADILGGRNRMSKSGFGLYSAIQRISLFYGITTPITITSEIGCGTEITIRTKILDGGMV
ncbi:MAG: histidine kinase [Lachnospiraceae bacterium]|nr:histidine kinase [Lachnospiraceae bacterium]